MSKPWQHPKSDMWWYRRATPRDLIAAKEELAELGFTVTGEVKRSLDTANRKEAKAAWSTVDAAVETEWQRMRDALKAQPNELTQEQCFAIVAEIGRDVRDAAKANPGSRERWLRLAADAKSITIGGAGRERLWEGMQRHIAKRYSFHRVTEETRQRLLSLFIAELGDTASELAALADGDYSEPERLRVRPKGSVIQPQKHSVTFQQLMAGWQRLVNPKPSSVRTYKTRVKFFTDWLKHDVANKVTADDVRGWRDAMLREQERGRVPSRETIRDRLAAVSTLLRHGAENMDKQFPVNAAANVKLKKSKAEAASGSPVRDFTLVEAQRILKAARLKTSFLRWAPWICAYTAMRIGEVGQLRVKDVVDDGSKQYHFKVTPEAGSTKTSVAREIPVHSALLAEGFIEYVKTVKGLRLFPELYRNRKQDDVPDVVSRKASYKMVRWVRGNAGLRIDDHSIHPSHSWRHFFNTVSRDSELDPEVRKAMVGHMDDRTAEGYGKTSMKAKRQQLEKLKVPGPD